MINEEIQKLLKIPKIVEFHNENFALSYKLQNLTFFNDFFEMDIAAYFFNSLKP